MGRPLGQVPGPIGRLADASTAQGSDTRQPEWLRRNRQAVTPNILAARPRYCGNGDVANLPYTQQLQRLLVAANSQTQQPSTGQLASLSSKVENLSRTLQAMPGPQGLAAQQALHPLRSAMSTLGISPIDSHYITARVRSIYSRSIDFSKVFVSSHSGLQGRPFTSAVPLTPLPFGQSRDFIQVMNLGDLLLNATNGTITYQSFENTVVHELTHVWQSQHHTDPAQYMRNCSACQAYALRMNAIESALDHSLFLNRDYPTDYPYSAYAYKRVDATSGYAFSSYGGEQIAEQVERGESDIVAHVRDIGANAVDAENVTAMNVNMSAVEDRRRHKVYI